MFHRTIGVQYDNAKCVNEIIYISEPGDVIDPAIESGTDKEEYDNFCGRRLAMLPGGVGPK